MHELHTYIHTTPDVSGATFISLALLPLTFFCLVGLVRLEEGLLGDALY